MYDRGGGGGDGCVQPEEVQRIKRYKFDKDRRLALGSLLLQRAVIHWTFGIPYDDIVIKRTGACMPPRRPQTVKG